MYGPTGIEIAELEDPMALPRPLRFIRPIFLPRDKNNAEFWLSHALIIASTVIGVYLAAGAGYRVGMELQTVRSDRESYYLQLALLAEVNDNLRHVADWSDQYITNSKAKFVGRSEQYRLETYVWDAMADSDVAFRLPPEALTGIRRLYRQLSSELAQLTDDTLTTEPDYIQIQGNLDEGRETILPVLAGSIDSLRQRLDRAQIPLR